MSAPAPLTWQTVLTDWTFNPIVCVLIIAAAGVYVFAASKTTDWRKRETACFLSGLAVTAFSVSSSTETYSNVLFSMHMAQHLLLITVAPALLVLGHPIELLSRRTTGRRRRALRKIGKSAPIVGLTHPLVTLAIYAAVVVGTHLTPFLQSALTHPWLHVLELVLYLVGGYLVLLSILGEEPIRWQLPPLPRLALLLGGMVVDTIVGVSLMMTPYEPFPAYAEVTRAWGPTVLEDLHWGGATMWVGGDALMAGLAIIVITKWVNSASSGNDLGPWLDSARRQALASTGPTAGPNALANSTDIDEDEAALRAYNAMLAGLAEGEQRKPHGDQRGRPGTTL